MSKAANTPPEQAAPSTGDVHERIAAEAAKLRGQARPGLRGVSDMPALAALMDSASKAVEGSIPTHFEHLGKTYYLRVSIGVARLIVFDSPSSPEPMALALSGSHNEFGHLPGH